MCNFHAHTFLCCRCSHLCTAYPLNPSFTVFKMSYQCFPAVVLHTSESLSALPHTRTDDTWTHFVIFISSLPLHFLVSKFISDDRSGFFWSAYLSPLHFAAVSRGGTLGTDKFPRSVSRERTFCDHWSSRRGRKKTDKASFRAAEAAYLCFSYCNSLRDFPSSLPPPPPPPLSLVNERHQIHTVSSPQIHLSSSSLCCSLGSKT